MAAVLAILAALNAWRGGHSWTVTGSLAALFLTAALLYPAALAPLNRAWFKFGLLLHKVVTPIVMALVFYGTVLPTGLVMRAIGKRPLRLSRQPELKSYWIVREPPGPAAESMKDQF